MKIGELLRAVFCDRRKQRVPVLVDRRKGKRISFCDADAQLRASIDRFSRTIIMHREALKEEKPEAQVTSIRRS